MKRMTTCETHGSGLMTVSLPGIAFQKPGATEMQAFESMKAMRAPLEKVLYFAIPWAEIIDKNQRIDVEKVFEELKPFQNKRPIAVTVCQHPEYKRLMDTFCFLGLSAVYASHCSVRDSVTFPGVWIRPFPLYACNVEDPQRRLGLVSVPAADKSLFYSFAGLYAASGVRGRLFDMRHPKRGFIEDTQLLSHYNEALSHSVFALCPVGVGTNTSRIWEALGVGTIPVILADGLVLPHIGADWAEAAVVMKEKDVEHVASMLSRYTAEDIERLCRAGAVAYSRCSGDKFASCIVEELMVNKSI